jgi:hypothetical protein
MEFVVATIGKTDTDVMLDPPRYHRFVSNKTDADDVATLISSMFAARQMQIRGLFHPHFVDVSAAAYDSGARHAMILAKPETLNPKPRTLNPNPKPLRDGWLVNTKP